MADMRPAKGRKKTAGQKRGPKEERLKINGNWQSAIKQSFLKEKPKDGWPKP
jgi:hypothetical protein